MRKLTGKEKVAGGAAVALAGAVGLFTLLSEDAVTDFQATLDATTCGSTVVMDAAKTYRGTLALTKNCGTNPIKIVSSRLAELPAGKRVGPAQAHLMPDVVAPGGGEAALVITSGASGYEISGIEFLPETPETFAYRLLDFSTGEETNAALIAHHIKLDRSYLHSHPDKTLKRGLNLNSADTEVTNCYFEGFKSVGEEAQAILSWNSPGRLLIDNNYLEGAGENVMFGGADPRVVNQVPTGIRITRNHFFKPLSWRGAWQVKNTFELKNARQVHVEGNLFENNWADAQSGFMVQLTVRNQQGTAPWSVVEDVTFVNNIFRHTAQGVNISGIDDLQTSQRTKRIKFDNNLFEDISPKWTNPGLGMAVFQASGAEGLTITNNTVVSTNAYPVYLTGDHTGTPIKNFVYVRNIGDHYGGIFGNELCNCPQAFERYAPGAIVTENVLWSPNMWNTPQQYPAGNDFPADASAVGFVDFAGGNYRLRPDSPYAGRGADIARIEAAMGGAIPVPQPTTQPTASPAPTVGPTAQPSPTVQPVPTPIPTPAPTPAPVVEVRIFPTTIKGRNAIFDEMWARGYTGKPRFPDSKRIEFRKP